MLSTAEQQLAKAMKKIQKLKVQVNLYETQICEQQKLAENAKCMIKDSDDNWSRQVSPEVQVERLKYQVANLQAENLRLIEHRKKLDDELRKADNENKKQKEKLREQKDLVMQMKIDSDIHQIDLDGYKMGNNQYKKFIGWLANQVEYNNEQDSSDIEAYLKGLADHMNKKFEVVEKFCALIGKVEQAKTKATPALADLQISQSLVPFSSEENEKEMGDPGNNAEPVLAQLTLEKDDQQVCVQPNGLHAENQRMRSVATKKYFCLCGIMFKTESGLKMHCGHFNQQETFCCEFCPRKFVQMTRLMQHLETCHQSVMQKTIVAGCRNCGLTFKSRKRYIRHLHSCLGRSA